MKGLRAIIDMKTIPLSQNKFAIVDDEDYEELNKYKWYCRRGYATRNINVDGMKNQSSIMMHRQILNAKIGQIIDHINRVKLDNRRTNLRFCTIGQNVINSGKTIKNTTGYKGVTYHIRIKKFFAQSWNNGKKVSIGYFSTAEDAGRAYDKYVLEKYGEFAYLNFPK